MYEADETYAVYDERNVKARKAHRCAACGEPIKPGQRYYRIGMVYDRIAESLKRCQRCQRIHEHLRSVSDRGNREWPDERLRCGHEYEELHGEPPPDEIAALAFVLPDEMQALGAGSAQEESENNE